MASYDLTDKSHFTSFCLFIVVRCFRKLSIILGEKKLECECFWGDLRLDSWQWRSLQSSVDRPIGVNSRCSAAGPYWTRQNDVQGDTEIRPTCHSVGVLGCDFKELGMVGLSVAVTTDARVKKQTEQEVEETANIYRWWDPLNQDFAGTMVPFLRSIEHERYLNSVPSLISFSWDTRKCRWHWTWWVW